MTISSGFGDFSVASIVIKGLIRGNSLYCISLSLSLTFQKNKSNTESMSM